MPIVIGVVYSQWFGNKRHPCILMSFNDCIMSSFGWKWIIRVNHSCELRTTLASTASHHILRRWRQMHCEAVRVVIKMPRSPSYIVVIIMLRTGLDCWVHWDSVRSIYRISHVKLALAKVGKFGASFREILLGATIASWLRVLLLSADWGLMLMLLLRYLRMVLLWWVIMLSFLIWWWWNVWVNGPEVLTRVCRPLRGPCYCCCRHRQCRVIAACIIVVVICILLTRWNGQVDWFRPFALLYTLGYI